MQVSTQIAPSSAAAPTPVEVLLQAFHQACTQGDTSTASALLRQLDYTWLSSAMSSQEREEALRTLRRLRVQLDRPRKRGLFGWH